MNAKETIIQMIKANQAESEFPELFNDLITAVENAIFDVPSEEDMIKENPTIDSYDEFIQYLRNYKKPETDGK